MENAKKCLLLIPRMGAGGAERVMATIANNLCREYEVRIVTMTDAESFYPLDSRVTIAGLGQSVNRANKLTKLYTKAVGGAKGFFALRRMVKEWQPDVLLSFLEDTNAVALLLKMLGSKCRLIVSDRNDPTTYGRLSQWFERHFYCKADVVVCQSEKVTRFFPEKHQKKTTVIPNPIAADAIPPRHEGKRRHTVVGVGRLLEQKNFPLLIRAFARLPEQFSDYTLEIYGGGRLEERLQKQIDELGFSDRIRLMGVKKSVMRYIADAALYVMSSDYEGFPNALAEAMASGIPVISTDFATGVARDLIKKENGMVVPVGDEDALLAAMVNMLSREDEWEDMSRANRALLETLSEENVMAQWRRVLEFK